MKYGYMNVHLKNIEKPDAVLYCNQDTIKIVIYNNAKKKEDGGK